MNLTLDQIRPCAAGCHEIRSESQGLFADRMTPALRTHFGGSEGAIIRARCQTGIRLRFRSDTRSLRIGLTYGRAARNFPCVDLVVDGVFAGTSSGGELFRSTEAVERAFEIWLPYSVESWLTELTIDDGAAFAPLPLEGKTWLVIGDSISQGMTSTSPSRIYPALAARAAGINHHNTGVGGARMEVGAGEVAGLPASFATVAFGCNDWNGCKAPAAFEADTNALLDRLLAVHPGLPVGLITPFPAVWATGEKNKDGVWLEAFREVLRAVAPRYPSVRLIEGPSLIPADPGAFIDGIHPNNAGMAVLARNLAPHLARLQSIQH